MTDLSDDIEIPVVQIAAGWSVEDVLTEDDCDDAQIYLTGAVIVIDEKIAAAKEAGNTETPGYRRLLSAKRWKQLALQIVAQKRGRIARAAKASAHAEHEKRERTFERKFMTVVKREAPELYLRCIALAEGEKAAAE